MRHILSVFFFYMTQFFTVCFHISYGLNCATVTVAMVCYRVHQLIFDIVFVK